MHKQFRRTPELKALLEHLQSKASPRQGLKKRAEMLTTQIIARLQSQSQLKK
jgi:hypothetical protein